RRCNLKEGRGREDGQAVRPGTGGARRHGFSGGGSGRSTYARRATLDRMFLRQLHRSCPARSAPAALSRFATPTSFATILALPLPREARRSETGRRRDSPAIATHVQGETDALPDSRRDR